MCLCELAINISPWCRPMFLHLLTLDFPEVEGEAVKKNAQYSPEIDGPNFHSFIRQESLISCTLLAWDTFTQICSIVNNMDKRTIHVRIFRSLVHFQIFFLLSFRSTMPKREGARGRRRESSPLRQFSRQVTLLPPLLRCLRRRRRRCGNIVAGSAFLLFSYCVLFPDSLTD